MTMTDAAAEIELNVTDLKQWAYCPRIPFYRYVLPVDHVRSYKMRRGHAAQAAVEALERRRRLKEYGLVAGERRFDVWVRSAILGLSGRIDLLVVTDDACFPIDFKDTEGGVRRNHRLQLAAYAVLIEESFDRPVPCGFVYLIPSDEVVRVDAAEPDRSWTLEAVDSVRTMIAEERLPEPTPVRRRCTGCEFQNYCADIW
ncbi:MAG: CRISPR-associated protein Cas4 [bacterium]|nr:CRISPR-associated protein Cas4 [bacterium]